LLLVVAVVVMMFLPSTDTSEDGGSAANADESSQQVGAKGKEGQKNALILDASACGSLTTDLQDLSEKLRKSAKNNSFITPVATSVCTYEKKIEKRCKDFNRLSPKKQRAAEESCSGFEYCEIDTKVATKVASKYIAWANSAKAKKERPCGWIERCLVILPGNEQCTSAANTFKCSIPKSVDCSKPPKVK